MRDRMERFVLLPFAVGCMSESSIGVASPHSRRSSSCGSPSLHPPITRNEETGRHGSEEEEEERLSDECSKSNSLALPKPNLSVGMDRIFKGFKSFSHLFVYKEEEEEIEIEIEIGLPTDVKHVTHIGWDECAGATNYPIIKGGRNNWDTLDFLKNNNDRHPRLQLLSKFNDYRHHQLPADPSSSAALSNLMVQLEGPPSTDRQDVKPVSLGHHLIADQVSEESIREHQQP